jgi:hypothetical protein
MLKNAAASIQNAGFRMQTPRKALEFAGSAFCILHSAFRLLAFPATC